MSQGSAERLNLVEARVALLEQALEAEMKRLVAAPPPGGRRRSRGDAASVPVQPRPDQDRLVSIAELSKLDGEEFVSVAYRRLLRKEVDRGGLDHYLYELSRGESKLSILRRLASEQEAIAFGVTLVD